MKRVQIEGVGVVGFPDDWTREQIEAAIENDILPRRATGSSETVMTATRGVTKHDIDKARSDVASEVGPLEAMSIGIGRFVDKAVRGLEQAVKGDWLPDSMRSPESVAAARERLADSRRNDEAYAPLAKARPIATAAGEIAATLPFGFGATTLPRAIMWGMAPGALEVGSVDEKAIGMGVGGIGGAAGNALGNLIAKLAIRRGNSALVDKERAELVQAARDAGIELMPHQVTGKTWQKNLHGALRENPFTSSQYDTIAGTQREQVDAATEAIIRSIGGRIDQPTAGAAAQRGLQKGLAEEAQRIDKAYGDVLGGINVDLSGTRAPFAQILAEQQKLPADVASSKAGASLRNMLGGEQGMQLDAALKQVLSPDKLKLFETISAQHGPDAAMALLPRADQQMVRELTKSGPAGFLRDSPTVPGTLAQDIRSAYTKASAKAAEHGDVQGTQAYARMRQAVDEAIDKSVPANMRGQFDAVNQRYGFGAALKNLPERDQQVLLNQIYRGMGSEDEFATFIAMAPNAEFRDVQRGFLTKLIEGAEGGGQHVNPAALGRTMAKLDPEALRVLGGDAGKDLFEVGRVGQKLLPDLANSQTANRAYWLKLINPSIMLAGAGVGGGAGGGGLDFQTIAGAGAGAVLAPKLASKMYLSPALRGWLEKMPKEIPGNKLAEMVPPELEADFVRALSAFGIASPIGLDAARRNTD